MAVVGQARLGNLLAAVGQTDPFVKTNNKIIFLSFNFHSNKLTTCLLVPNIMRKVRLKRGIEIMAYTVVTMTQIYHMASVLNVLASPVPVVTEP